MEGFHYFQVLHQAVLSAYLLSVSSSDSDNDQKILRDTGHMMSVKKMEESRT